MKDAAAIEMLSALAQTHRLRIFRRLVKEGPSGLAASKIAKAAGISPTSASFHLKELERSGLLVATRRGRFIHYAVDVDATRGLLTYLTEDCCRGEPEICRDIARSARINC